MTDSNNDKIFTILIVDDKPENIFSLEQILEKEGRKFLSATSGNEALKMVLKHEEIGLIMLDVQMPEMDGFEVARILKTNSKTKHISVIFVTAINKEQQYVLKGFEEGAVDYLQKPLDVSVTQAKVDVFEKLYFYQHHLKTTANELDRINKQLDRFVHIVSHDLKSPLATIILMLSGMEDDRVVKAHPDLQEKIELVYLASKNLADMIDEILEYSKQSFSQQTIETVDVYELVQQIVFLMFPSKNISVNIHEHLPTFKTRKLKLQQVFQNLISNSIKYLEKEEGIIEIGYTDKGRFYEFFVKDNGPGISLEDQHRLFKLFQTGSNRSNRESSTGIGLNILKMIVEEQGGRVWVESEKGKGSTFYFEWSK